MPPSPSGSSEDQRIVGFLAAVEDSLSRHGLVAPGDRVLVALSGGPDSVALLCALHRLAPRRGIRLAVAHLHHGIRGAAADADVIRCRRLARDLGLAFITGRVDVPAEAQRAGLSLETAARQLRYAFLTEAAAAHGCRKIALGHQKNDNAELVLMNLIRGSGPLGLAGMPPARQDGFIRPLLEIGRRQIIDFLEAIGAGWAEDETNRHLDHTRNWVRQVLLPLIAERANPAVADALHRTARIAREEELWLAAIVRDLYRSSVVAETTGRVVLDTAVLEQMPPAARRRVLRCAIGRLREDLHRIGLAHIEAALALMADAGRARRLDLPHRLRIQATAGRLEILRCDTACLRQPVNPPAFRYALEGPGRIAIPELAVEALASIESGPPSETDLGAGQWSAFFDIHTVSFPLIVRSAVSGDRFHPLGAGGRQKVAKFFIDHKIPRPLRQTYPVVESGGRIVWLAGQRLAEAAGARPGYDSAIRLVIRPADTEKDLFP